MLGATKLEELKVISEKPLRIDEAISQKVNNSLYVPLQNE
jgi:hypothetical protein